MRTTKSKKRTVRPVREKRVVSTTKVKTSKSTKRTTNRKSSVISLENGIKIVKHAIDKKISLSSASNANGKGKNYISDIKARLEVNYKSKNISKNLYDSFKRLNKQYQKEVK